MLPLESNITPIETGVSSLAKYATCCSTLFSNRQKSSRRREVTGWFARSRTVTLTRTTTASLRKSQRAAIAVAGERGSILILLDTQSALIAGKTLQNSAAE